MELLAECWKWELGVEPPPVEPAAAPLTIDDGAVA
jgi:hypothetical protein